MNSRILLILYVIRFLFGAIFVWSGVLKLLDPIEFANAIRNFELVKDPIAPFLALLIPVVEVVCGLLVAIGILSKGSLVFLLGSLAVFSSALVFAAIKGLDIACGCFGGTESTNYPLAFIRNAFLVGFGIVLLIKSRYMKAIFKR